MLFLLACRRSQCNSFNIILLSTHPGGCALSLDSCPCATSNDISDCVSVTHVCIVYVLCMCGMCLCFVSVYVMCLCGYVYLCLSMCVCVMYAYIYIYMCVYLSCMCMCVIVCVYKCMPVYVI